MTLKCITALAAVLMMFGGCDNSTNETHGEVPATGLLSSTSNLVILLGVEGKVIIGGGIEPYSVTSVSQPSKVSAVLSKRELLVTGLAEGASSITVTDGSSPAKSVTIIVTVKKVFTAGTAGSLAFTSDRENFSANSVGELAVDPPTAGEGAIALQEFGSVFILSYLVHTPTDIDLTLISFESNTSIIAGTYSYPGAGKTVEIGYYPNVNPNDSTFLDNGYALTSSAAGIIDSITSTAMKGRFSGTGFFYNKSTANTSLGIAVTGGLFTVPIYYTRSMSEMSVPKGVLQSAEMIRRKIFRLQLE